MEAESVWRKRMKEIREENERIAQQQFAEFAKLCRPKIVDYRLIIGEPADIENTIKILLKGGWEPYGEIKYCRGESFCREMVKYSDSE